MLGQRPRDEDALLLAARERSERVVFIVLHADVLERVSHDREVRLPGPLPQADRDTRSRTSAWRTMKTTRSERSLAASSSASSSRGRWPSIRKFYCWMSRPR